MRRAPTLYALACLGIGGLAFAQAVAPDRAQVVSTYVNMCMTQVVNIPPPIGESDLKDSPKLQPYCQCFAGKFADRLILRLKNAGPVPPRKQSTTEEQAMRNSCRQQLGLPQLTFPP